MKRFASLLIILFLVIACQSQVDVTQTIPANTSTPEITLTSTSQPTTPPQATPTQTLSVEFPDWVKNPETQILLIAIGTRKQGYENIALFNAESGERFDVPFTEEVGDYFWLPNGSGFGFLTVKKQVILFSIRDEVINIFKVSDEALMFYEQSENSSSPLQVSSSNISDPTFLLLDTWNLFSSDRKYFVYQEEYDGTYTSIYDISKNEIVILSDQNDEYFDINYAWSPTQPLLAIIEVDEERRMYNSFQVLPTFRLRVYDVQSQQVVASYKNVTFPKWSPDGTKFLFQEWKDVGGYYWHIKSPPCIFDTVSGKTNCFNELMTNDKTNITSIGWSPDQTMISYIEDTQGSFCSLTLLNKNINCISANFGTEKQYIKDYLFSTNGDFISFVYDKYGVYSDLSYIPKLGIANIQTGEYFQISESTDAYNYLGLWRPSPNP